MIIEITGQGCQWYPHKSYHTGVTINTYQKIENGVIVDVDQYQLPDGTANYIPLSEAVVITAVPANAVTVPGGLGNGANALIDIDPSMVFNGISGNEYQAKHVYTNGSTAGMTNVDAMVYPAWYNAFGQQFGF